MDVSLKPRDKGWSVCSAPQLEPSAYLASPWAGIGPQDLDTYLILHHGSKTFMHMSVGLSGPSAK